MPSLHVYAYAFVALSVAQRLPDVPYSHVPMNEVDSFLTSVAEASGGLAVAPVSFGSSIENRQLKVMHVSAHSDTATPAVLLTAMHHGREPAGMIANLQFVHNLLAEYAAGEPRATCLLRHRRYLLVPNVNPDAYEWNIAHPSQNMARKNRRQTCPGRRYDDTGVDLNRNYPFEWDIDNEGSSPDPCRDDYRGPSAFSEPESQAMRDLLDGTLPSTITSAAQAAPGWTGLDLNALAKNITVAINWHSFGRLVNLPYAVKSHPEPPAHIYAPLLSLARSMAGSMGYTYAHPWQGGLYSCNGEASDWMVAAHGVLAYSPEIGPAYSDSMNDAQFASAMWPRGDTLRSIVNEAEKGLWVAAAAAGSNVMLDVGTGKSGIDVQAEGTAPCSPDLGLDAAASCVTLTVKAAIANQGARPAQGDLVMSVVPATTMSTGPLCLPAAAGTGSPSSVCVPSLAEALAQAKAHTGSPFCPVDEVSPKLAMSAAGRGRQLETADASAALPLLSSHALQHVRAQLQAFKQGQPSDIGLIKRRDSAWRADLSTVVEQALELQAQEQDQKKARARQLQRNPGHPPPAALGGSVWYGSLPAWSKAEAQTVRVTVPVTAAATLESGCPVSAPGTAVYVSVSDEHSCTIYRVGCGADATVVQEYMGPTGCAPCAHFRHLADGLQGPQPSSVPSASPAPAVPTSAAPSASSVPAAIGPTTGSTPGPNGTAGTQPSPADTNDAAWRDDTTASTAPHVDGPGAAAWPWAVGQGIGGQAVWLAAGTGVGLLIGVGLYCRYAPGSTGTRTVGVLNLRRPGGATYVRVGQAQGPGEGGEDEEDEETGSGAVDTVAQSRARMQQGARKGGKPAAKGSKGGVKAAPSKARAGGVPTTRAAVGAVSVLTSGGAQAPVRPAHTSSTQL